MHLQHPACPATERVLTTTTTDRLQRKLLQAQILQRRSDQMACIAIRKGAP